MHCLSITATKAAQKPSPLPEPLQPILPTEASGMPQNTTNIDNAFLAEFDSNSAGETCKVCNKKVRTISALQDHIIATHCKTSKTDTMLERILLNQEEQKKQIQLLSLRQTCIKTDLEEMKTSPGLQGSSSSSSSPTPHQPTFADIVQQPSNIHTEQPQQIIPEPSPHAQRSCASSILYIGDSIFRNVYIDKIEKETKAKIKVVKAYSSVFSNNKNNKFKSSNFTDLMPKKLQKANHDAVVMQASSTDLTNHKAEKNKEKLREIAQASNANMLSVATTAVVSHPELKKIVLFERTPRFDELEELNKYANKDLHSQWQRCDKEFKKKIIIGKHNLKPHGEFARAQHLARWGDSSLHQDHDNLHLRGNSGQMKTTDSILAALFSAGLSEAKNPGFFSSSTKPAPVTSSRQPEPWQQAGGRRHSKGPHRRQEQPFQLPLQNRYIQGNF